MFKKPTSNTTFPDVVAHCQTIHLFIKLIVPIFFWGGGGI